MCQRVIRRANGSAWCRNVAKVMLVFQIFLLRNAKGNLFTLKLYKQFCIIFDIIVIHIYVYVL